MDKQIILLVDDDAVFVEAVSAVLGTRFTVRSAGNGTQAFEQIAREKPDVIVLDVMMDHLSEGFEVAQKLMEEPGTARIPVIMLTGVDQVYDTRMEVSDSHFTYSAYLEKPVEPVELMRVVEQSLASIDP